MIQGSQSTDGWPVIAINLSAGYPRQELTSLNLVSSALKYRLTIKQANTNGHFKDALTDVKGIAVHAKSKHSVRLFNAEKPPAPCKYWIAQYLYEGCSMKYTASLSEVCLCIMCYAPCRKACFDLPKLQR